MLLVLGLLAGSVVAAHAAATDADELEAKVRAVVERPEVTIVHLWAPWCPNCKHEMRPDGWAKFVADNPAVKVVFLNIWHGGLDPEPKLAAAKLGDQPNFVALTHPNPSRRKGEQLSRFLDLPVGWVPTTWVFRAGKLRYAINYGEVRFDMLQQMVNDATAKW